MTECLTAALEYLARGWSVFPLVGKKPAILWRDLQRTKPSAEQVKLWWEEHPDANVGVALGAVSGLVRVDADGQEAVDKLHEYNGGEPTMEFSTPSGGRGWLYKYMDGTITETVWKGFGQHQELRVQSDGAYTVVPPSPGWVWLNDLRPATMPRWLRDRNIERVLKDLERELRPTVRQLDRAEVLLALEHISPDDYDTWIQVGMALRSDGEDMLEHWIEWAKKSHKFVPGECERKWATFRGRGLTTRSLLHWAEQTDGWRPQNRYEPITELGNARILSRMAVDEILHSAVRGWVAWDGTKWRFDGAYKTVQEAMKRVLAYRMDNAIKSLSSHLKTDSSARDFNDKIKRKRRTMVLIRQHETRRKIEGSMKLAESEPALTVDHGDFDAFPYVFNCPNCSLDFGRDTVGMP